MTNFRKFSGMLLLLFLTAIIGINVSAQSPSSALYGAWQLSTDEAEQQLLLQDNFFFYTVYSKTDKRFIMSTGGTFEFTDNRVKAKVLFDSSDKEKVGGSMEVEYAISGNQLTLDFGNGRDVYTRVDNGKAPLAGVWRITSRLQNGKLSPIHQTGTRQTYKILTGTRFQWAAIDPATKEFSGTGGGSYTFENGKYTENIAFFSRDNSRVGASLSFNDKLENGEWHHSGLSSKGEKIYEVWSRARP